MHQADREGFRLEIHGSPAGSCGGSNGWSSRGRAGWLALPRGPLIESSHGHLPGQCTGQADGGLCNGGFYEDVVFGGVVGDNARLGGNVTVAPGTVIGNGARVEDGAAISGRVPPGAEVRRG